MSLNRFRLLAASQTRIAIIRDEGAKLSVSRRPGRRLRRIGTKFLQDSLESRTIAAELGAYAERRRQFVRNAAEWHGVDLLEKEKFLDNLREWIVEAGKTLLAMEQRVREGLVVEATMISAIANLRVQRWLVALAAVTVAVGIVAVIVAVIAH